MQETHVVVWIVARIVAQIVITYPQTQVLKARFAILVHETFARISYIVWWDPVCFMFIHQNSFFITHRSRYYDEIDDDNKFKG